MNLMEKLPIPRWLVNIIGLKIIYQIVYIIFSFIIVKKLAVNEYGFYSYIVALTVYFSSVPLLGLPLYLQRNVARESALNYEYFIVITGLVIIALAIALLVMPSMPFLQKFAVMVIILTNCLVTILVAINDGVGKYAFQYKFFFFTNMWMVVCIFQALVLGQNISYRMILEYWSINAIVVLCISLFIFFKLTRSTMIHLTQNLEKKYPHLLADLILLYAVGIPDGFAKFYDKFLANKFFTDTFLGNYSFNLMAVSAVYALFIRPINSVLFTQMAKIPSASPDYIKLIKKYYFYGFITYLGCYCIYVPFSTQILTFMGLTKYFGTIYIFKICFLNAILYLLSVPFTSLITLSESGAKKLLYCFISLLLFNIPLLCILLFGSQNAFLFGFVMAYFFNLILSIGFEYKTARTCFAALLNDSIGAIRYNAAWLLRVKNG